MSLLETMIYGYRTIFSGGVEIVRRSKVNFGSGLSAVDDPTTGTTKVTATGGTQVVPAYEIDWEAAGVFTKLLDAGAQVFTFTNAVDGQVIIVVVTGAVSSVTWPTVEWAGGVAPTQTSSGKDVYTFVKAGSSIIGTVVQDVHT